MTTGEANQVGAFSLGRRRYDLLIMERYAHLLQPLVLDGRCWRQDRRMRTLRIACSSASLLLLSLARLVNLQDVVFDE